MTEEKRGSNNIDELMNDGKAALEDGQFEVAAELFRRVVQAAPFRHDAREYLAYSLDKQFSRDAGRLPGTSRTRKVPAGQAMRDLSSRLREKVRDTMRPRETTPPVETPPVLPDPQERGNERAGESTQPPQADPPPRVRPQQPRRSRPSAPPPAAERSTEANNAAPQSDEDRLRYAQRLREISRPDESSRLSGRIHTDLMDASALAAPGRGRPRARQWRLQLPRWAIAGAGALLVFFILVFVIAPRLHFANWFRNWPKRTEQNQPSDFPKSIEPAVRNAQAASAAGNYDQAITALSEARDSSGGLKPEVAASLNDEIARAYAAKASSLLSNNRFQEALETAQEGLQQVPENGQLNFLVGHSYERMAIAAISEDEIERSKELYENAVAALEKAVAANPKNLEALDLLAGSYVKVYKTPEAVEVWKRIISTDPDSPQAEKARGYLQSLGFTSLVSESMPAA